MNPLATHGSNSVLIAQGEQNSVNIESSPFDKRKIDDYGTLVKSTNESQIDLMNNIVNHSSS